MTVTFAAEKVIAGAAVGLGAVAVAVGCMVAGWAVNRCYRLGVWAGGASCWIGAGFLDGLCLVSRIPEIGRRRNG